SRGIWVMGGKVEAEGDPQEIAALYKESIPKRVRKRQVINLKETIANIKENEVVKVENLGVKFKVDKGEFWPLKNVNFSIREGEIVGIIGHNGAGKTTLCRALSGIYRPDEGKVFTDGRTSAL